VFSVRIGLLEWERSIFSKGDDTGEEGNSGGVTASCSLDEAELDRSRKRAILAEVQETSSEGTVGSEVGNLSEHVGSSEVTLT
jgi:hypothetical protein